MQNMKKNNTSYYTKKISQGIVLTIITFIALFSYKRDTLLAKVFLYETIPYLNIEQDMTMLFKFNTYENTLAASTENIVENNIETFASNDEDISKNEIQAESNDTKETEAVDENSNNIVLEDNTNDSNDLIGISDVIFQDESTGDSFSETIKEDIITKEDLEKLKDIEYLKNKFYIVDPSSKITKEDFNVDKFVNTDLKIDNSIKGPKVLIIHTHIHEMFADSDKNDLSTGIMGVGENLKKELEENYGIEVMHHQGSYDYENGSSSIKGAYERLEPVVTQLLKDNPSIQVVIDLHRDGIAETASKTITSINGNETAHIMFFNGLSKIMKDGVLVPTSGLENKNLPTNLAFSFDMQLVANSLYPNFTRKIYLKPYRYSLHMLPKSTLIEIGTQKNTMKEAFNTAKPLAEIISKTILK